MYTFHFSVRDCTTPLNNAAARRALLPALTTPSFEVLRHYRVVPSFFSDRKNRILDLKLDHPKDFTTESCLNCYPPTIPDAGASYSGHGGGGKPGKAPAARNKTRGGGAAAAGGFVHHSGYDGKRNYKSNNHQGWIHSSVEFV